MRASPHAPSALSRAFVKEDASGPDEDPPERLVPEGPNYVTPRGARLLEEEEARLVAALSSLMGLQEDPIRKRRKRELERDLRYVRARLETASPVDPASVPPGEVRFGVRVSLRSAADETRLIRIVGQDEAKEGGELVPWSGPFVQAFFGLKTGQSLNWESESGSERWTVESIDS